MVVLIKILGVNSMSASQKNWKKIAEQEFKAMDKSWQREWQNLRKRAS